MEGGGDPIMGEASGSRIKPYRREQLVHLL